MSDDLVGRVVGERFRLERQLGAGGMGEVYLATDTSTDKRCALKVIRESLAESKEAIARFEREVSATAALAHPNIVRFLAAGQDGALRYLAMELLEGGTLKERIGSRGAIPWRDTLPILRGVVQALGAAHDAGLIHRDLKPENIFLAQDEPGAPAVVKLLDFGVAKHTALPDGMTMTGTGIIVGTPGFVAPEVVLHGVVDDPRSDFYGLGATWFEMLTGSKPFSAATPFALAMRHLNETPPRPTTLVPFSPIPEAVEALLSRLLAKAPAERPANARALLAELDSLEEAANTPLSTPNWAGAPVDKTITDMSTPRPATPRPAPANAVVTSFIDPASVLAKKTPGTGLVSVEDVPDAARAAGPAMPRRRAALIAAIVLVFVVGAVAVGLSPASDRPRKRDDARRAARRAGQLVEPPPPLAAADAGTLGPAAADAGPTPSADAGAVDNTLELRPRPRRPRRHDAGTPAGPSPNLDVD